MASRFDMDSRNKHDEFAYWIRTHLLELENPSFTVCQIE